MSETRIKVHDNGPLLVEGPFKLVDADGNELPLDPTKTAYAFCRCGESQKKPFCDGSHKGCGFESVIRSGG